ncbi:hypothetical protein [Nocardioides sp.]|uniref:hypothetical protein n=1 Tax=Nocardioides sp. TaxID=35761 RepID=UPI0039E2205C
MPSAEHETPLALIRADPGLVGWLLGEIFGLTLPAYATVRPHATEVQQTVPHTYHADAVVVFADHADQPVLAVVVEVQRAWEESKRRTWRLYLAHLEAELDLAAALVVYCPDPVVAARYERLAATDGISSLLRPLILTPDMVPLVTDVDIAEASPPAAVLSMILHAGEAGIEAAFPALAAAILAAGTARPERFYTYYDIVLAALPGSASTRWEDYMTSSTPPRFYSEKFRRLWNDAQAEGQAEGRAEDVLLVLQTRGIEVPTQLRQRVLATTDTDQLTTWLRRAVTATRIEDVLL